MAWSGSSGRWARAASAVLVALCAQVGPLASPADAASVSARTALVAAPGGFRATATLVPTEVAQRAAGGIELETATGMLSVTPTATGPAAAPGVLAGRGAAAVFPAQSGASAELVRPRADGVETFTAMLDRRAPSSTTWRLALDEGLRLVPMPDGSVEVIDATPATVAREPASEELRSADIAAQVAVAARPATLPIASGPTPPLPAAEQAIARIDPPVATDAKGRQVPAALEVGGDELTMRVDTAAAAFPVLAGPAIRVRPYRVVTVEDVDLAAAGNCRQSFQKRVFESLLGTDLGWVKLKKRFCWDRARRRVTTASGVLEYDTTEAGSLAQWDVDQVTTRREGYFTWQGRPQGGHQSLAAVRFRQSALGWGLDSETVRTEILGHSDGSVRKP